MNFRFVIAVLAGLLACAADGVFAQSTDPYAAQPASPEVASGSGFSQPELDQMLAPIALYPDALLTQVLIAATYPLEVVEAARWSQAHQDLRGTEAVDAAGDQPWDPNVKALLAFPDLLQTMSDKLDWTQNLGDAFLAEQSQVMDTVQALRQRAQAAGNLRSGGELSVYDDNGMIDLESAAPDLFYLPYYDPNTIYGNWWWPGYPPVYWAPWAGFGWFGGFAWGHGLFLGNGFFCNDFDWFHHRVRVFAHGRPWPGSRGFADNAGFGHAWRFDPDHRRGVAFGNPRLNREFGHAGFARPHTPLSARELPRFSERSAPFRGNVPQRFGSGALSRGFAAPQRFERGNNAPMHFAARAPVAAPHFGGGGARVAPMRGGGGGGAHFAPMRGGGGGGAHFAPMRSGGGGGGGGGGHGGGHR